VLAVRERHHDSGISRDVVALAVTLPGTVSVLCSGHDFFAAPRPDPTGHHLAWISWDHPDMPWDASELWVGELVLPPPVGAAEGARERSRSHAGEKAEIESAGGAEDQIPAVRAVRRVAGGRGGGRAGDGESVGQPLWFADGCLTFASDAGGWWQPWRWRPDGATERLCDEEAEFHGPDWQLGQASFAELPDGALACRRRRDGVDSIGFTRRDTRAVEAIAQPCATLGAAFAHDGGVAWLGATPAAGIAPWWAPAPAAPAPGGPAVLPAPFVAVGEPVLDLASVSVAEHFSFAVPGGQVVHGLYYPPLLSGALGREGIRPPLVVTCHGGPTGCAEAGFDPVVQLFTSRGIAVAAVDYSGSTGYGRAYRRRLWGAWGVTDVDDCVDAARHLAGEGKADPTRMAIRGSSAGGFTALNALVRSEVFAAAVSWYGVTDLLALAAATHDFESRYCDRLVGPLPEATDEYRRRSPLHQVGAMTGAVLVLQGMDDPVVPPAQATSMVEALRRRGLRCEYLSFAGESHGFRRADTLQACLEAELAFYEEILCSR
jgi:acetyl esterase/lipase